MQRLTGQTPPLCGEGPGYLRCDSHIRHPPKRNRLHSGLQRLLAAPCCDICPRQQPCSNKVVSLDCMCLAYCAPRRDQDAPAFSLQVGGDRALALRDAGRRAAEQHRLHKLLGNDLVQLGETEEPVQWCCSPFHWFLLPGAECTQENYAFEQNDPAQRSEVSSSRGRMLAREVFKPTERPCRTY